jgi:hypothetical protein
LHLHPAKRYVPLEIPKGEVQPLGKGTPREINITFKDYVFEGNIRLHLLIGEIQVPRNAGILEQNVSCALNFLRGIGQQRLKEIGGEDPAGMFVKFGELPDSHITQD